MGIAKYLLDGYTREFTAHIVKIDDTGMSFVLDETYFYPTSGGQPNDTGTITCSGISFKVVDVIKKDGEIWHQVDHAGLRIGDTIIATIDWDRRYILMRYHTGSHILATLIHDATGAEITGNQLYLDKARVDFSLENFDRTLMNSFEEKTNAIIAQSLPVTFRILDREEAFKIPSLVKLRKQLHESIQEIRIVDVGDFDHQACGGTHLKNTSEIGRIEIYELENKGKERRRIYFRIPNNT
ncbi:MAG: alanyl-tRNA editing protein [Candidatus Woesearchaeota archaeon]